MSEYFEDIFDKQPFGFPKGYNTQQCLLKMLEIWKSSVDKGRAFSALLTDLSRAFDSLDHELLIAKRNAYGFSLPAFRLIHDSLSNRKQRARIKKSYSICFYIILVVPPESMLLPLFIQHFQCRLIFFVRWCRYCQFCQWKYTLYFRKNTN